MKKHIYILCFLVLAPSFASATYTDEQFRIDIKNYLDQQTRRQDDQDFQNRIEAISQANKVTEQEAKASCLKIQQGQKEFLFYKLDTEDVGVCASLGVTVVTDEQMIESEKQKIKTEGTAYKAKNTQKTTVNENRKKYDLLDLEYSTSTPTPPVASSTQKPVEQPKKSRWTKLTTKVRSWFHF